MERNSNSGGAASRIARVLRSVGASSEGLSSFFKTVASVSISLGAYYLVCYIILNNISLPVSIGTAATLLVALGFTAAVIVGIALMYTLVAMLVISRSLGEIYFIGIWTTSRGVINPSKKRQLVWLLLTLSLPQTTGCLLLQAHFFPYQSPWEHTDTVSFMANYLAIPLIFGFGKMVVSHGLKPQGHSYDVWRAIKLFLSLSWGALFINVVALISTVMFIAILGLSGLVKNQADFWAASLFFVATTTTIFFVRLNISFIKGDVRRSVGGSVLLPQEAFASSGGYAVAIFVAVSLFPSIASGVGRSSLALLGIGGGLPRVIYAPIDGADSLPAPIVDSCDEKSKKCKSKVVTLLLNAGSVTIVLLKDEIFSLNTEHDSVAWPLNRGGKK